MQLGRDDVLSMQIQSLGTNRGEDRGIWTEDYLPAGTDVLHIILPGAPEVLVEQLPA